jgi:2-polyprenyl-6-hydroxyphenyl methylase/3-demethylubiquinone-9 3-methyltransferase
VIDGVELHSAIATQFDGKYATSPMFKERLAVWRDLIQGSEGSRGEVLDAGCGSGVLSVVAAGTARRVVAFDGSAPMIELARRNAGSAAIGNIELHIARIGDDSFLQQRSFDLVLCSSVLEYLEDYWQAFDWLAALLKPRGRLIFSMPNASSLYRQAEAAVFRLTGRPAYYAAVKSVPPPTAVLEGLRSRGVKVPEIRFYGAAPLMSSWARPLGLRRFADTLFVVVCERGQ